MFRKVWGLVMVALGLLLCALPAAAQPQAVTPFPRSLSGTLAFQSDVRTPLNPNGRLKIYTLNLATGQVATRTPATIRTRPGFLMARAWSTPRSAIAVSGGSISIDSTWPTDPSSG